MIYYANPLKELYFRVAGAVHLAFSRRHDHFWVINERDMMTLPKGRQSFGTSITNVRHGFSLERCLMSTTG
jgi:hypothetical protein